MVPALLITAPHAGLALPAWLAERARIGPDALWQMHDPGTGEVGRGLDAQVTLAAEFSRAVCDLDHEIPDDGRPDHRFPQTTLGGEPLFEPPLDWTERRRLIDEVYTPWYAEVRQRREDLIRQYGRLAHLDLNTWGRGDLPEALAGELERHPKLMLANGGYPDSGEGERVSATPRATRGLALALRQELGLAVGVNHRFKGGGVMRTFGHHAGNTLQLTWQRSLVTTPDELHLDPMRLRAFTRSLSRAIAAWLQSA